MAKQWPELTTGAVVLIAAVIFAVMGFQRANLSDGDTYHLSASFRSVEGIRVGSPVRLAGVQVGSVVDLELNPITFRADAIVAIREDVELPDDSAIIIASEGFLGGNFVEIQPGGSPFNLAADESFTDTQGAVSLVNLLLKFVGGGD